MSFQQVVHLLLNPFAGRANRQQFLFFVLIFLVFTACGVFVSIWLEDSALSNAYKFGFIAAGVYFLFVGIIRRFKDSNLSLLFKTVVKTAKFSASALFYFFMVFFCTIALLVLTKNPVLFLSAALIFWCSASSPNHTCSWLAFDLGVSALFVKYYLLALLFIGIPLLIPHERSSNKYGPPPVGFNFRTMLKATYPAALAEQFEAIEEEQQNYLNEVEVQKMIEARK